MSSKRVWLFARVRSLKKSKQIERQVCRLREYCSCHGYSVIGVTRIYADDKYVLEELDRIIREQDVDIVLADREMRFGHTKQTIAAAHHRLKRANIQMMTLRNSSEELTANMEAYVDRMEQVP